MGSQTQPAKVPIVDLSKENLKPGTDAWLLASKEVKYALEEYGCFEAIYNKVPLELHNSTFSLLEDLFNLPLEIKMQNTSDRPYHSYFGQYSFLPLYESLGVDNPTTLEGAQRFTSIMWPEGNDEFRESAHSFSKLVAELDEMVTKMVFENYGVERLYEPHMASTTYLLRCFKYRAPQLNETDMGLHPHKDKTFISILHQNEINGLQIKTKDGQWIDVEPSPSSFLVMAGDAFMAWSNDRAHSCDHQVIMKEKKTRYSMGLFAFNSGILQVPEELVDEKHPLLYRPFDHFGFLVFNKTPEGMKSECPIKDYCGV
ncbi:putative oxoglutarate/iron-dependent dioxygenase, non-heme dioxygenase domain-containing protein [Rosa chinensis]|uniref:Putative oxoglutarate/iron-dependent dioxygenase, non-heme dioxygenase domain-containing protein n=1 Tax=Rosa chinensis TaxID=74649 RepID=A0A2P6RWJ7_ROSCH|nr:probable 2-oxoglutarate-dependent dioxygenase AOP1 [Rosa chinensis]PRQ50795.1 putative oxoglutarate/iron-dependent dioxygenase, non-heme dioxygenase domain-containing protein [Rosa chinensis]